MAIGDPYWSGRRIGQRHLHSLPAASEVASQASQGLYAPSIAPAATVTFLLSLLFPPILVCFRDQQPPRELEASTQQLQKAACSVNPAISFGAGVSHVITCSVILEPVGLFNPSLHPSTDLANHQVLLPAFLPNQDVRD